MCIHVDVGNPPYAVGQQPGDGDRSVVVDTKSRGPSRHGVMETAGEIYGVNHLTCTHGTRGIHRAAGDEGGSLVHQVEDWVVLAAEPIVREEVIEFVQRRSPHHCDVGRVVHERQDLVGRRLWGGDRKARPCED
jgi:hypothetical protein